MWPNGTVVLHIFLMIYLNQILLSSELLNFVEIRIKLAKNMKPLLKLEFKHNV
jgi:hypothetical protein